MESRKFEANGTKVVSNYRKDQTTMFKTIDIYFLAIIVTVRKSILLNYITTERNTNKTAKMQYSSVRNTREKHFKKLLYQTQNRPRLESIDSGEMERRTIWKRNIEILPQTTLQLNPVYCVNKHEFLTHSHVTNFN